MSPNSMKFELKSMTFENGCRNPGRHCETENIYRTNRGGCYYTKFSNESENSVKSHLGHHPKSRDQDFSVRNCGIIQSESAEYAQFTQAVPNILFTDRTTPPSMRLLLKIKIRRVSIAAGAQVYDSMRIKRRLESFR